MTPAEIKAARRSLGLTAPQFGALMSVATPDVYRIEAGTRPPPVRFVALLRAYLTSPNSFATSSSD